ncbi:opsin-1 [Xylariaceae sp. FL0662B]|nr:opsin-1 [Xylariaceae sp. FL0662B]
MIIPQEIPGGTARIGTLVPPPINSHTSLPPVIPGIPRVYYEASSEVGQRTLWVVCVLMGLSSLVFYGMAYRTPVQKRILHVITALVTTFAFLSYYALATGDGVTTHEYVTKRTSQGVVEEIVKRDIYWARYVDASSHPRPTPFPVEIHIHTNRRSQWSLTTPLLLLDLSLLAGINGASILVTAVSALIMMLTGLFAAFSRDEAQAWGWYAFACLAYLNVVYQVGFNGRDAVANRDSKTRTLFGTIALYAFLVWTVYPIIWAVADAARLISVDHEIIAYAVLDLLAKAVFGFWLLIAYHRIPRTTLSLDGFWSDGIPHEGAIRVGLE